MRDDFFRTLMDNLYDGVYFVDRDRRITFWNRGAERLTGFSKGEAVGRSCFDNFLSHIDERGKHLCQDGCPLAETINDGVLREADVFLHHKDGHRMPVSIRISPIRGDGGEVVGAVEVFSDNSAKVASERRILELEKQALLDELTRVGNRRYMEMNLKAALASMKRYNTQLAVFFLDIDHFKDINDRFGHNFGDEVLRVMARTLLAAIRPMDFLGRWGGEEFVAAASSVNRSSIRIIGERFRRLIEVSSVPFEGEMLRFTVSIGATMARAEDTLESVIERADQLMYSSKQKGRNRITVG